MSTVGFPHHWTLDLSVSGLAEVSAGYWGASDPTADVNVPVNVLRNGDLSSTGLRGTSAQRFFKDREVERATLLPGDIAMTSSGDCGKLALVLSEGFCVSNFVKRIRVKDSRVLPRWLYLALQAPVARAEMVPFVAGTTIMNLKKSYFDTPFLALPPLEEQERIVEVLEEHLSRLDAALASIQTVRDKAAQFRRSLLHGMFADKEAPSVLLGEIAVLENGDRGRNYPSKSTLVESGVPFVNAGQLVDGRVAAGGLSHITDEHMQRLGQGKFRQGDILFCLRGSLGKCALVDQPMVGAIASSLVIVRPRQDVSSEYLFRFLESPQARDQIERYNNGTAQPNLAARDLRRFELVLPNPEEQRRRIARLDAHLSRLDAALAAADRVEAQCAALRRSLLHAAFTGKLTSEWRETAHV